MNTVSNPRLIEPGVKFFLHETLKNCHQNKKEYYNMLVNAGLLLLFILIFGIILRIKYKGKLTPREKRIKERKIQEYLISNLFLEGLNLQQPDIFQLSLLILLVSIFIHISLTVLFTTIECKKHTTKIML